MPGEARVGRQGLEDVLGLADELLEPLRQLR
jgi:hypothetical protein